MNLVRLVWIVAIHSVIHGSLGAFFIASSEYVNKKPGLIYTFIVLNVLLVLLGIGTFCVVVWRRPFCARLFGLILIILALIYLIMGFIYFMKYKPFLANSIFDVAFCRNNIVCWIGPEYPMTFWHVVIFLLLVFILFWFLYGFLLCKYACLACCIPCPLPPCKPKPKPRKCIPVCPPRCDSSPCSPPCSVECPPPCPPPCNSPCPPPCPPPFPPQPCKPKKTPRFILSLNRGKLFD